MIDIKCQTSPASIALQQALRALDMADQDRRAFCERGKVFEEQIRSLQSLIDNWFKPRLIALEHANIDLARRCREAEEALAFVRNSTST